jgi:DNA-binding transcriptional LysR family regulator
VDIATVRIERRDLEEDLQSGELDAAVDVMVPLSGDVRREPLSSDAMAVLARAGHPMVQGTLSLETYLAMEHVLVTGRRHGGGYEDLELGRHGWSRRIRVRCQQRMAANDIVSRSDLLVTMSCGYVDQVNRNTRNQVLPFPLDIPRLELFLYWHANVDDDPASCWFRRIMLEVLGKSGP